MRCIVRTILLLLLLSLCGIAEAAKKPTVIIVKESQQVAANAVAVKIAGPYAANTFSVPFKKGSQTYYVCSWDMDDSMRTLLVEALDKIAGTKPESFVVEKPKKPKDEIKAKGYKPKKKPT